jgi:hypothetical protein
VQGHLRNNPLQVKIETTCGHCGEKMELFVDSDLSYRVECGGPNPLVFEPDIDWSKFEDPNIIDGY